MPSSLLEPHGAGHRRHENVTRAVVGLVVKSNVPPSCPARLSHDLQAEPARGPDVEAVWQAGTIVNYGQFQLLARLGQRDLHAPVSVQW